MSQGEFPGNLENYVSQSVDPPFLPPLGFFFKLFLSDFFLISSVRPCESGTAEVVSEDVYHYYFSVLVIVFRVVSSVNHGQNI